MISKLIKEISQLKEPTNISSLQRILGVDRGTLEGMLQYLVQKGYLLSETKQDHDKKHHPMNSSIFCAKGCPFALKSPLQIYKRTYTLNKHI